MQAAQLPLYHSLLSTHHSTTLHDSPFHILNACSSLPPYLKPHLKHLICTMAMASSLSLALALSLLPLLALSLRSQSDFLSLVKQSLQGPAMARWDFNRSGEDSYCSFPGVACDNDDFVVAIDLTSWFLSGNFPPRACSALPRLRVLGLGFNDVRSGFPVDPLRCSALEDLNCTHARITGTVPDLSPFRSLRSIDLSNNLFRGDFPISSLANLTDIEVINFNENPYFNVWRLPEIITRLTKLRVLILSTTCMRGEIPAWIGNMTSLTDLELSGNLLGGQIPPTLGKLAHLQLLELYYNKLTGEIPEELGNLTRLIDIDLSENHLVGSIPESLCRISSLQVLQVYTNNLTGGIPRVLGNSTALTILSVYGNKLTGEVPPNIGKFSNLIVLEVSENQFSGELPRDACAAGKLLYFLVVKNNFSGGLPATYAECKTLLRFRVNNNQLSGLVPQGLFGLPHASIIDLGFNNFEGIISKSIANAKNLTALFLPSNRISGILPPEIGLATSLVKIDLSNNLLSGPIPAEIGNLSGLNQLSLQGNKLDSSIPDSLSSLKSLNVLNLSNNLLTGEIPDSLCELLPNSLDFSNNQLSGPIPFPLIKQGLIDGVSGNPQLCVPFYVNLSNPSFPLCPKPNLRRRLNNMWIIGLCAILSIIGILLLIKRWFNKKNAIVEQDGFSSSSSFSYDVTSFHKLSFEQHEIVEALIEKNIIGHGGSGTVYKIELSNGELVAVKKLWSRRTKDKSQDELFLDRELRTEVETLGSIRHKNIVKLYCCFSGIDSKLLVYEYMPNGNLWDALHHGKSFLDWPTRHKIAIGIAQGLAYLHHDLLFPIVHRDIKTSNILLDADFEPKVADFGIAKVLQARGVRDTSTTVIAGTYGYLAPEYAYSMKATTKCDVYSFGVVLMELVTGKKPIELEFGENRDIIQWVSSKMSTKQVAMEVLDKRIWNPPKEEMIQLLKIAVRCTCSNPVLRPTMNEVVLLLIEAHPCKPDVNGSFKLVELKQCKA
ncbi:receptor-like protein kinase HSL1 [Canna indica]|uniref:Receptor-like protein kinase HSL1 n=1 Tax=Canna indica TaxID=4628 RepID=A0AAQ3KVN7_9LILI|nr:receptor-like protein kinase HSL1 [Canna indica]